MNVISPTRYGISLVLSFLFIHQYGCDLNFCLREENDTFNLTIKNPWAEKLKRGIIYDIHWGIVKYGKKLIYLLDGSSNNYLYKYDKRASLFDNWGLKLKKITPEDSGQYWAVLSLKGPKGPIHFNYSVEVYIIDIPKLLNKRLEITPNFSGDSVHQLTCGQDLQSGPVSLVQLKNLNDPSQKIKSSIKQDGLWLFQVPEDKSQDEYTCEINTTSLCDICQICTETTTTATTTPTGNWIKVKLNVTLIVLSCIGVFYILATIGALVFWYFTKYKKRNSESSEKSQAETKRIKKKGIKSKVTSEKEESVFSDKSKKTEEEEQANMDKFRRKSLKKTFEYLKTKYPSIDKGGSDKSKISGEETKDDTSKTGSSSFGSVASSSNKENKHWDDFGSDKHWH